MNQFYTHVFVDRSKVKVRGWRNGRRFQDTLSYKPYLFIRANGKTKETPYKTLFDKPVERIDFDSIHDAREFTKNYSDVANFNVYGSTAWQYVYLFDRYKEINYDPKQISVVNTDIEVYAPEFPDPWEVKWPVTAITLEKNDRIVALAMKDYDNKDSDVTYIKCETEQELLTRFLEIWMTFDPDVVTGWNTDGFDIPYLVNRIRKLLGDDAVLMLSPWKKIEERKIKDKYSGEEVIIFDIVGVASLDYMALYKKFSFSNEESYSLNNIASVVVGEKKLDYSEYESLADLYERNFQLYLEYNIRDVRLVSKIDKKLGFINQVFAIAYDSLVNYADTFTSVKIWEIIMHNHLLRNNIVSPAKTPSSKDKMIAGGFVKEPVPGMYHWPVSFDLDSLYPKLISQYNISPETFVDVIDDLPSNENSPVRILEGYVTLEKLAKLKEANLSMTASGALFSREKKGFVPVLMDKMYDERALFKEKMLAAKRDLVDIEEEMKKRGLK